MNGTCGCELLDDHDGFSPRLAVLLLLLQSSVEFALLSLLHCVLFLSSVLFLILTHIPLFFSCIYLLHTHNYFSFLSYPSSVTTIDIVYTHIPTYKHTCIPLHIIAYIHVLLLFSSIWYPWLSHFLDPSWWRCFIPIGYLEYNPPGSYWESDCQFLGWC